jgi:hypothetical protein
MRGFGNATQINAFIVNTRTCLKDRCARGESYAALVGYTLPSTPSEAI